MATSGSFNTSGYSGGGYPDHYIFSWSLASQSIEGNYSVINWSLSASGGSNQYRYTSVKEKYVNVDGENHSNSTVQNTYNGTTPFSGTKTIYHNSDGTKSFSASAGGAFYYYGSYNSTGSGSWSLPTIPRQANITSAPDFNDEGNPTIGYQNQAGNSATSLQACISLTGTADDIKYRDISKTGTSYTFNLTEAERTVLRNSIPTSNTRSVVFFVKTVIGGNTFYSTITKTFSIVNGNPTFNAENISYIDSNDTTYKVTQNRKQLVQNLSNLLVSITSATPNKGASMSKYEATINNVTKTITDPGDIDFGNVNSSSNLSLVVKATDSRGNSSSASITVMFLAWVLPSAIISLKRKNNYEDESYLTVDGTYSSIDSKNKLIIEYQKKKTSDTDYSELTAIDDNTTITMINDKNFAWDFRIKLTDSFGTTTYNVILAKGQFIFFVDTKKLSVGINCFPTNSESLEINGNPILDYDVIDSW